MATGSSAGLATGLPRDFVLEPIRTFGILLRRESAAPLARFLGGGRSALPRPVAQILTTRKLEQ
jgi:hypothetical protein